MIARILKGLLDEKGGSLDKEKAEKKLSEKLEDIPWNYTITDGGVVKIGSAIATSTSEREFLQSLKREGTEESVAEDNRVSFLISRKNGKLWLNSIREGKGEMGEPHEITENEALKIFREEKNEESGILDYINPFKDTSKKEAPSNQVEIKVEAIESIETRESEDELRSIKIVSEDFIVDLGVDGTSEMSSSAI